MNAPFRFEPEKRGYVPLYRSGNACPGCDMSNWLIGRRSVECASCGVALPFAPPSAISAR